MCSGNACTSSGCCAQLYNLYCQIFQIYRDCPPNAAIIGVVTLPVVFAGLNIYIQPLFNRAKCGKIDCCDGIVNSIICAYQVAFGAMSQDGVALTVYSNLITTIEGILTAAGYYP